MTAASPHTPWHVRPADTADPADAALLSAFECRTSDHAWDAEVERFVRHRLLSWQSEVAPAHAGSTDARILLLLDRADGDLLAVGAHERQRLTFTSGDTLRVRHIEVVAVARRWQGRDLSDGNRPSDIVMSAVLRDIEVRSAGPVPAVTVVVHRDNVRSLALAHRYGLTRLLSPVDDDYLRWSTEPESAT